MHRIIHQLKFLLSNTSFIYEKISQLHIYPTFNAVLIGVLGAFAIIFSLKKNKYYGLSFEECYKIIVKKSDDCNKNIIFVFLFLVIVPLLNYISFESALNISFILELIIVFVELICLIYIIYPFIIIVIEDEKKIKKRVRRILTDDIKMPFEGSVEVVKKIIDYKLFVKHDDLYSVLNYIGYERNKEVYFYVWDNIIRKLRFGKLKDKKLIEEVIKDIIEHKKNDELKVFIKNIKTISFIMLNLQGSIDENYLVECLSQSFLLCKIDNYKKTGYKQYTFNLITRVIIDSINQNDIKFLYTLKKAILKTFNNCYPIELIHVIDGLLFNLINFDNNMPQHLKNRLKDFLNKPSDLISWKQLVEKCKWQIIEDYEDYIDAYGIQDYDLTYEPPYSKLITCTYDNVFRFDYYFYNLMNYHYHAGRLISEIISNNGFIDNNRWILFELSKLIKLFNDKNFDFISTYLRGGLNEELYEHNIGEFNELLSRMNSNVVGKIKGFIDINKVKKDINDKYEKFNFFDREVRSNSIVKNINQIVYITNETYNEAPNILQDSIDFTMKNELNDILMSIGDKNNLSKNDFREKFKSTDIAFADEWTIKSIYNDDLIYNDLKIKNLNLDVLLYGRYLIMSGFAIHIKLNGMSVNEINDSTIDDYIIEYRINNNQYYYENKYFTYNDIKDYILNKNKVNIVKYNFIISYAKDNKDKIVSIDV